MADQAGEKTHQPTEHRREQAREQGQLARSPDLASAATLLGGAVVLAWMTGGFAQFLGLYARRQLGAGAWLSASPADITVHTHGLLLDLGRVVGPVLGLLMLIAIGVNLMQTGLLYAPQLLVPDPGRINPLKGFGRLFSLTNFARLLFGMFKIGVVAVVAAVSLYKQRDTILGLVSLEAPQLAGYLVEVLYNTTLQIAFALVVLAILDYAFQRWKHETDLKMTTEELREEMKNQQGDPQVIGRRRQVQRQLALNRISSAVPKADVVVTNPTELAVAIQYDATTMAAPIVVAKGAGVLAQRIRRLALEHGVPIVEKKPLAQALYKEVDINKPVPSQFYSTVAEVLAYVYQLKGKKGPRGN